MSLPLGVAGAEPTDAAEGTLAYATDTGRVRVKTGSGWDDVGAGTGGPPTGAAGGDLGGTYPNPTVTALHSATTSVNVSAATAPTSGQVLTATSSTAATWQTPAASGVTTVAAGTGVSVANPTGPTATVSVNYGSTSTTACVGNDSRLSDSRTPSGSASGDLSGSYPSPNVARFHETSGPTALTLGSIPDLTLGTRSGSTFIGCVPGNFTHKAAPTTSDKVMMSDAASSDAIVYSTLAEVAVAIGGTAGSSGNPFIDPPASPNADNDEFTSFPGSWIIWDQTANAVLTVGGTTIDPWTDPAAGTYRYQVSSSWVLLQFPRTAGPSVVFVYKPITPASNMLVWSRFSAPGSLDANTLANSYSLVAFALYASNGSGRPSSTGYCGMEQINLSGNTGRKVQHIHAGTRTNGITLSQGVSPPEIFGVFHKTSSAFGYFAASGFGDIQFSSDSVTSSGSLTAAYVGYRIVGTGTGFGTANPPIALDFFRRKDSATAWIL